MSVFGSNLLACILFVIKFSQSAFRNYGWRFWTGITGWFRLELLELLHWNTQFTGGMNLGIQLGKLVFIQPGACLSIL